MNIFQFEKLFFKVLNLENSLIFLIEQFRVFDHF